MGTDPSVTEANPTVSIGPIETGPIARHYGAGSRAEVVAEGVQASGLALGTTRGAVLTRPA